MSPTFPELELPLPAETLTLTCATKSCGAENVIMAPAEDGWEPIHEQTQGATGRIYVPVARRIVIRCTTCGERTEHREDIAQ